MPKIFRRLHAEDAFGMESSEYHSRYVLVDSDSDWVYNQSISNGESDAGY